MTRSPGTPDMPSPRRRGYAGRTAQALSEERRQRLMDTGLELFGTNGYIPTTVEKICAHAQVTTRHFYEHFRDREALLIAVFETILAETRQRLIAVMLDESIPLDKRLDVAIDTFLACHLEDPRRARITTQEIMGVSPHTEAARNAVINGFADMIEAYLQTLVARHMLPARNYRVVAVAVVGAMHELQIAWLSGSLGLSRQALVDELCFLVNALVKSGREAQ